MTEKKKAKKKKAAPKKKKEIKLILVESPTKIKTIKKFVKRGFEIQATKGHLIDLPKSRLGVDIENNFEPTYIVLSKKRKVLTELKKEIKKASEVYLAADPDREGEAICWHIASEIKRCEKKLGPKKIFRVLFNEITESAVLKALENPLEINLNLVNAQQARRVLDRLVGYKISPLLWGAIRKGLSAGRVQSVALKLIVERQREIEAFNPVEYWSIEALLKNSGGDGFKAKLSEKNGEKLSLENSAVSHAIVEELKSCEYKITEIQRKERKRRPYPPFITSAMQQEAARKLRFTAYKTMAIAQQLYEGVDIEGEGSVGLITYMRTDSLRISAEAQQETLAYIKEKLGSEYAPEVPNFYKSKKSAQDAHEAIRPTSTLRAPEAVKKSLDEDQYRLYSLIWKRLVASQMTPAVFDDTKAKISALEYTFSANGSIKKFDGFLRVYGDAPEQEKNGDRENGDTQAEGSRLPELYEGEILGLESLIPEQHFTQPPPAYSDATLVKALEEKDIGRPSTYAPIISTLVARKYMEREKNRFVPTELGLIVNDVLQKSFPGIINEEFTAKMEDDLDRVEEGTVEWHSLMAGFYTGFEKLLENAVAHMDELKKSIETETGEACEKCGAKMVIKWGRFGKFISCEKYPDCKNAKTLVKEGETEELPPDEKCPECASSLIIKQGPYGSFIACSTYPGCKYTKRIIKETGSACPDCGGSIVEKAIRGRGKFFGCSNYPKCKFMTWDIPLQKECPSCKAQVIFEKRRKKSVITYCAKCDYKKEELAEHGE